MDRRKRGGYKRLAPTKEALEDADYRALKWKELMEHLRAGYSPESSELGLDLAIDLIGVYPNCPKADFDAAIREGQKTWETIGKGLASGTCLGNSKAWSFTMSHRFGWSDRQKIDVQHGGGVSVNVVTYSQPSSEGL